MNFSRAALEGIWIIESEQHADERGYFMRVFCEREFAEHGLPQRFVQSSLSSNPHRGTLRGLHFQWPPSREGKLVRCLSGAIYDVVVDLRPHSSTFLQRFAVELSERNARAVYIPDGFAHGFQVLEEGARVLYQMTDFFDASLSDGFRYDDRAFAIRWPQPVTLVSERDRAARAFDTQRYRDDYTRRASSAPK
jgi:dTDP-4-dehydrorhamnose 3,5-epimerase